MKPRLIAPLLACLPAFTQAPASQVSVPPTKTVDAVDTYFGKAYHDPYRWLENLKDPEVAAWFKAQAVAADAALDAIPGRESLVKEWTELDKLRPAVYGTILFEHGRLFYKKTLAGQNTGKLYWREGWTGAEKLLFDPSTYKAGVVSTLQAIVPSFDGRRVAIGISAGGAEISEIRVIEVDSGKLRPDSLDGSYGPTGWTPDNQAFFYDSGQGGDPQSVAFHLNRKIRLHRLGAKPGTDPDILSAASAPGLGMGPEEGPTAAIDETLPGYLFGGANTAQSELSAFIAPISGLKGAKLHWTRLCKRSDDLVQNLAFHGGLVYAVTYAGAPNYKVIATDLRHPDWKHARTIVPEGPAPIQYLVPSRDYLLVVYSDGITGRISRLDYRTGKLEDLKLPLAGNVSLSCPDVRSNRCLASITSWTRPTTLYEIDAATGRSAKSVFDSGVRYPGFENLVVEEVEVPSYDGTKVPLSIIHAKDLPMDGSSSCVLEGYGAYGYTFAPGFSLRNALARRGAVVAIAHVRGGGEKGEAWHKAGFKATKPNTWKDFIACAEYLVAKGYTSPSHLAGTGTSAGGILISRAITERPDLFAAAVCNVGDADAMRSEFGTDGPANSAEYGSVKDEAECAALYEMDGMQHVKAGVAYPAVLGVCGWNDPRVAPWQPGKFIAALQNATVSANPVLLKVNYDDGHFTEDKTVTFRNFAAQYAFLLWRTGHKDFQPAKDR
ncbi:MAG TPA: prolyl oligopeptidase family serine peptidase [Holophagaceae bacterium]|nr:prolyl oligopeptidase family serine peptidase [Holophagaceae bacterium]